MLTGSNQDKGKISPCVQLGVLSASQTAGFLALFPLHCIIYLTIKIFKDLTLGIYLYKSLLSTTGNILSTTENIFNIYAFC